MVDQLNSYTKEYFIENVLIVILAESLYSTEYSVDSVHLDGKTMNVMLKDNSSGVLMPANCTWCILVECKRIEGITSVERQVVA